MLQHKNHVTITFFDFFGHFWRFSYKMLRKSRQFIWKITRYSVTYIFMWHQKLLLVSLNMLQMLQKMLQKNAK